MVPSVFRQAVQFVLILQPETQRRQSKQLLAIVAHLPHQCFHGAFVVLIWPWAWPMARPFLLDASITRREIFGYREDLRIVGDARSDFLARCDIAGETLRVNVFGFEFVRLGEETLAVPERVDGGLVSGWHGHLEDTVFPPRGDEATAKVTIGCRSSDLYWKSKGAEKADAGGVVWRKSMCEGNTAEFS